jgi:hypothetical protein
MGVSEVGAAGFGGGAGRGGKCSRLPTPWADTGAGASREETPKTSRAIRIAMLGRT